MIQQLTVVLLMFICLDFPAIGQKPTKQDCLGAIPICTEIYEETTSPAGSGNYHNEISGSGNGGISCMDAEVSSIWYTFTVNKTGNFGFVLTPNDLNDDYDWALFDITNASCNDIFSDISLQVSCNAAGGETCNGITGADGKTTFDLQGGGCGFDPPNQRDGLSPSNDFIEVQQGNTYVLIVSNWTKSTNGYKIDFSAAGDLGIFDNVPPKVAEFTAPVNCEVDQTILRFSENIQLITINNAQFNLSGPDGDHAVIISSNSQSIDGDYDKTFQIQFDPPITELGSYQLEIDANGATDILDLCGNPLQTVPNLGFEITAAPLPPIDLVRDTILCDDATLTIDLSHPRASGYLWDDGSILPTSTIVRSGIYAGSRTSECGVDEYIINVEYSNCGTCEVFVPNAFTPNGDLINDVLEVFSDCTLRQLTLTVFDRWGDVIFKDTSEDQQVSWDGKSNKGVLASGVYIYLVQYQVQELGITAVKSLSGDVAVIR